MTSRAQQLKSGDISLGLTHEWVCAFGRSGGTASMLQESIENASVMIRVIDAIKDGSNVSAVRDATIGPAYYDVCAVNKLLSLGFKAGEIAAYGSPPDGVAGYLTFFDPGWDILRLRQFCIGKIGPGKRVFAKQDWYDAEAFAGYTIAPKYRQLRMFAVPGSFVSSFRNQKRRLEANEEVPTVRAVIMGTVIHFLMCGQRLFHNFAVRCADTRSNGNRIVVGNFGSDGFTVCDAWDDSRDIDLGLASCRKL